MALHIAASEAFLRAVRGAKSIELTASLLPRGKNGIVSALEAAAANGARVNVRLESAPYDPAGSNSRERANTSMIVELRAHGVDAALAEETPQAPLHLKAAVVDGKLFLDDRNWLGGDRDTIVSMNDPHEVDAARAAMRGRYVGDVHLALRKREALKLEADTIRSAGGQSVSVESESFGNGAVADALLARAKCCKQVRLLVSARDIHGSREAHLLTRLAAAGVAVRLESGKRDEKLCVAGNQAWVGSANATVGFPDTVDWGVRTKARATIDALRATFERNWRSAKPYGVA